MTYAQPTPARKAKMRAMHQKGVSMAKIARSVGISPTRVQQILSDRSTREEARAWAKGRLGYAMPSYDVSLLERQGSMIIDITMSAKEYREIQDQLKLNQAEMSRLIGVDHRTVQRWAAEETQVPAIAARFLRLLSEAGISGTKAARLIGRRMDRLTGKAA